MQETIFRGKTSEGEWVYGWYYERDWEEQKCWIRVQKDQYFIDIAVIPESVGQFTGLRDKNEIRIYEGDILKYDDGDDWETGREEVEFKSGAFNCACYHPDNKEFYDEPRIIEVIGNIYENPELITTN